MRVVGKLIKRVPAETECAIGEEPCGLGQDRVCMYQVFSARQVCEKDLANGRDVFWKFMDLEDTIDQHGMWQIQRVYGFRGKLFKAVQSFYVDSGVCVWVGMDVNESFLINVVLRQGYVMSSWLINVNMELWMVWCER